MKAGEAGLVPMQFLRSVLGSGPAKDALPYELGQAYPTCWGSWTHYKGTSKVLECRGCVCKENHSQLCDRFEVVGFERSPASTDIRQPLRLYSHSTLSLELAKLASGFRDCKLGASVKETTKWSWLSHSSPIGFQSPARSRHNRLTLELLVTSMPGAPLCDLRHPLRLLIDAILPLIGEEPLGVPEGRTTWQKQVWTRECFQLP